MAKYHLNIIGNNVTLPQEINHEFDTIDEAVNALNAFVHSYDFLDKDVCGRVCDEEDEDQEYCNNIEPDCRANKTAMVFASFDIYYYDRAELTGMDEDDRVALLARTMNSENEIAQPILYTPDELCYAINDANYFADRWMITVNIKDNHPLFHEI